MYHARGKISTDQVLCESSLKCKSVPNFDDGRNVLTRFQIKEYIPVARTAKYVSYQRIFRENIFHLISLITCADAIYIDYLPR